MSLRSRLLRPPERHWRCPSCGRTDVTREHKPHTRMHPCPALKGFLAPMAPAEMDVIHRVNVREDYVAGEDVRLDGDGTPIMSIGIERGDGSNDTFVYAPTAHGGVTANH